MAAPWHCADIFTFVYNTRVEMHAGTVTVLQTLGWCSLVTKATWGRRAASFQSLVGRTDCSAREWTAGPGLRIPQSWSLAGGCRGRPWGVGVGRGQLVSSTHPSVHPSVPRPRPSRHLRGWLEILALANGPRNTSQGQTQEVSDTCPVFHSLGVPNS